MKQDTFRFLSECVENALGNKYTVTYDLDSLRVDGFQVNHKTGELSGEYTPDLLRDLEGVLVTVIEELKPGLVTTDFDLGLDLIDLMTLRQLFSLKQIELKLVHVTAITDLFSKISVN